ncbi:TetR/AcrR family transcriptional regulator [Leptospira adleri]|uniref:TetR/AcrR family transcriptional regulator n=1 Tax=Leptospira adleri TaxID=2023186 RepID=UPI0010830107|nr:TetR/AcrR family transcriptional regulator [Leptospira adleri]TGM58905.1 TetR/AcrR family transcriptional regulator [Leptospira adleri]
MKKRRYSKSAYEDILTTADDLFYNKGYSASSLAEILASSGSHKASFYLHFPTKSDLAKAYIRRRTDQFLESMQVLMDKNPDYRKFVKAWVRALKEQAIAQELQGCSLGNLRTQALMDEELAEEIKILTERWLEAVRHFIKKNIQEGTIPKSIDSEIAAKRFLISFEGTVQMFQLTGDLWYLERLETEWLASAGFDKN